jgi:hypothetical protein
MKRKNKPAPIRATTYTWMHALLASPIEAMPQEKRNFQLIRMWQALADIEQAPSPSVEDWRVVSDAVNLLETLVTDMKVCEDASGLLNDAVAALASAGRRYHQHGTIRLDAIGIQAVRAVLEDYAQALDALPHRTMVNCHMKTEIRIRGIYQGTKQPHDVEVMAL